MQIKTSVLVAVFCVSACAGGVGDGATGGTGGGSGGRPATIDREQLSGTRLKNRFIQGSDGSQQWRGFFDTTKNQDCVFMVADDGKMRCLPFAEPYASSSGTFSDASCTVPVFTGLSCGSLGFGLAYDYSACPQRVTVHSIQPFVPTALFYKGAGGACSMTAVSAGQNYFRSTAKISALDFVEGTLKTEQ